MNQEERAAEAIVRMLIEPVNQKHQLLPRRHLLLTDGTLLTDVSVNIKEWGEVTGALKYEKVNFVFEECKKIEITARQYRELKDIPDVTFSVFKDV